jgi:hypothetical protein
MVELLCSIGMPAPHCSLKKLRDPVEKNMEPTERKSGTPKSGDFDSDSRTPVSSDHVSWSVHRLADSPLPMLLRLRSCSLMCVSVSVVTRESLLRCVSILISPFVSLSASALLLKEHWTLIKWHNRSSLSLLEMYFIVV